MRLTFNFFLKISKLTLLLVIISELSGCAAFIGAAGVGMLVAPDRRTTGTMIDDQTIKIKAQLALNRDLEIRENSHVTTKMYNRTLLLTGQAANEKIRQKVFNMAAKIPEIEKIYNEVKISEPTSAKQRVQDNWITTKVKCNLWLAREIGPSRVSVITENGTVYLMGILSSEERNAAVNIARKINGVKQVVQLFESLQDSEINTDEAPIG